MSISLFGTRIKIKRCRPFGKLKIETSINNKKRCGNKCFIIKCCWRSIVKKPNFKKSCNWKRKFRSLLWKGESKNSLGYFCIVLCFTYEESFPINVILMMKFLVVCFKV